MAMRRRGKRDEAEILVLLEDDDGSFTDEAGPSTGSNENLRLMVLGGDDALMDKACGTILGERQNRDAFKFGKLEPSKAQVCGRQVSVLKTPSRWLEHLKSFLFFSRGVKSLKNDIEFFETRLFPGPHAFLLVHRDVKDSGREDYLLRALSDVFGMEVLDYCMVLFIDQAKHNDPKKNYCLKMCGSRYHTLDNTDNSVNKLFKKIETMSKKSSFFTNHLERFRAAENYFEAMSEEKENKLRRELAEMKDTVENQKTEINDMKELNEQNVKDLNEKIKENQRQSKDRENQLNKELDAFKSRENQMREGLKEELIIYKGRCEQLKDNKEKLQKQMEQLKDDVKQLQNNLTEAHRKEAFLSQKIQSESKMIQREEEVHAKERELNERERELESREKELNERQNELDIREREVTQREVPSREHHQTPADTPPAGELQRRRNSIQFEPPDLSRDNSRPLEELKSDDSQASGSLGMQKPVRRNSKELRPPDMSESEHGPLHTL